MKKYILLALVTSFSAMANSQLSLNMKLNPAGSFEAKTDKVKGNVIKKGDSFTASKITVKINTLRTDNDLRDEHLWKHLNSSQHTNAILTDLKGKDGKATAMLEVAGVKKPITIDYKEKQDTVVAHFKVNGTQFKLPTVQYLGVGVADEIDGEVTLPFKQI
jgi:polyisoprenoid-binding protein YceI